MEFKDGKELSGCYADIDQDLQRPGVQADCKVTEVRLEYGKPRPVAAGAPYDCAKGGTVIAKGDGGTYTFSIKDTLDPCHFAFFSDQQGLIYTGTPIR